VTAELPGLLLHKKKKQINAAYTKVLSTQQRNELELQRETDRLLQLESQLREIKRHKELKRAREAAREQKKVRFHAACVVQRALWAYANRCWYNRHIAAKIIQQAMRAYIVRCKHHAVLIVRSFLRVLANKSAVSAAGWAATVIRRFACTVRAASSN
jgi:hypothetical protein